MARYATHESNQVSFKPDSTGISSSGSQSSTRYGLPVPVPNPRPKLLSRECNGFNSHLNRADGHTIIPATTCVYTPWIDMKPSDTDTMLTAMIEAERLVKSTGQDIVVVSPVTNNFTK